MRSARSWIAGLTLGLCLWSGIGFAVPSFDAVYLQPLGRVTKFRDATYFDMKYTKYVKKKWEWAKPTQTQVQKSYQSVLVGISQQMKPYFVDQAGSRLCDYLIQPISQQLLLDALHKNFVGGSVAWTPEQLAALQKFLDAHPKMRYARLDVGTETSHGLAWKAFYLLIDLQRNKMTTLKVTTYSGPREAKRPRFSAGALVERSERLAQAYSNSAEVSSLALSLWMVSWLIWVRSRSFQIASDLSS